MSEDKFTIFTEQQSLNPNRFPYTQEFIDAMHEGHWTVNDFDFSSDVIDFKFKLTDEEREIVQKTLSAIGNIEAKVKTFWANLGLNLPQPCFKKLGYVFSNTEVIHGDAYERLFDVLDMKEVFEKNGEVDVIKNRMKYLNKHTHKFHSDNKKQFIYSLILFSLFVENVSLFSQFYIVMWFYAKKNLLKQTAQQIKYTCREETLHALAGIRIIQDARKQMPEMFDSELEAKVLHEAQVALECEYKIVEWICGDHEEAARAKAYIASRMNKSLTDIGFSPIAEVDAEVLKETVWMDELTSGDVKTDFFHSKPTEYSMRKISSAEIFGNYEDREDDNGKTLFL